MRKLPARYNQWAFVFFMTLFMGLVISGLTTAFRTGVDLAFFGHWLRSFASTYVIVVPTVVVVTPLARMLANRIAHTEEGSG